ncbi:hypothetical protein ELE36_09745 [Pseudolysobacter antarcticus]|uniref:Uncharacterized protein n=1 Tax=Pseudolysobacter antarcticus TaxID=2511995 RepID=A0A411HJB2_9GAMM|nr:hypothetical protein [Pseudolysobacter antarcticus]QBB70626.1 hypothetical protein ELE36_09745 [Pseudolysobacter antarcticus]
MFPKSCEVHIRLGPAAIVAQRCAPIGVVLIALCSCATIPQGAKLVDSPDQLASIQQERASLLEHVKIGMGLAEFRALVPEAYVGGQSKDTTAYELAQIQKYVTKQDMDRQNFWVGVGSPGARTTKQVLWFYFYKDQLVKWGRPQDWPDHPDLVIEHREP